MDILYDEIISERTQNLSYNKNLIKEEIKENVFIIISELLYEIQDYYDNSITWTDVYESFLDMKEYEDITMRDIQREIYILIKYPSDHERLGFGDYDRFVDPNIPDNIVRLFKMIVKVDC